MPKASAKPSAFVAAPPALRHIADLTPDPQNANLGTPRGRAMVESSLRRYGFGRSVLVDKHGKLIAGNKTVEAAAKIGDPDVIVVETTGKSLVVVQRTDLDLDVDLDAKELAVADNRSSEVGLAWNAPTLQALGAAGGDMSQFFRPPEWAALVIADPDAVDATIPEMEIQPFEHHDYIVVVFTNSQDWSQMVERLGLKREGATVTGGSRKIGLGRVITSARLIALLEAAAAKTP